MNSTKKNRIFKKVSKCCSNIIEQIQIIIWYINLKNKKRIQTKDDNDAGLLDACITCDCMCENYTNSFQKQSSVQLLNIYLL